MTTSFIPPHMMQEIMEERNAYYNLMHSLYGQIECLTIERQATTFSVLMPMVKEIDGSPLNDDDIHDATMFVIHRRNASIGTTNELPLWEGAVQDERGIWRVNRTDLEEVENVLLTHYGYVYAEDRK